jgi:hypothetical protein
MGEMQPAGGTFGYPFDLSAIYNSFNRFQQHQASFLIANRLGPG